MSDKTLNNQIRSRGNYARSEETRARVLDAALAEACESGFQNTSVTKIAARASVAVGMLNYHFGSKKKLLRELMSAQITDFLSHLAPPDAEDDFFKYEEHMLCTYLELLEANPTYVRLAEEVRHLDPELYRAGTDAHIRLITIRIRSGIERGDLRPMAPDEVRSQAYFMLGIYTFLDRFQEDNNYTTHAAVAKSLVGMLRGGIAP